MTSQVDFTIQETLDFLKESLDKKGYDSFRILGKIFREGVSYDKFNKVSKDEFLAGLRDTGVLLPKSAAEKLVQYYDKDIDGFVNFQDFLISIRGVPNRIRQEIIDLAFKKFDKDGTDLIDVRDLKGVFNGSKHPQVISGEITLDQAFDQFLKNFNDRTGRGKICKLEWDDFYAAVSYSLYNDDHFTYLVKSVWQLD